MLHSINWLGSQAIEMTVIKLLPRNEAILWDASRTIESVQFNELKERKGKWFFSFILNNFPFRLNTTLLYPEEEFILFSLFIHEETVGTQNILHRKHSFSSHLKKKSLSPSKNKNVKHRDLRSVILYSALCETGIRSSLLADVVRWLKTKGQLFWLVQ